MRKPDSGWGVLVGVAVAALLLAGLVYWSWRGFQELAIDHWFAALIGVAVGATEMMARYRDRPFAPMLSIPGVVYIVVNAGAAALAFFLVPKMGLNLDPVMHVLMAGLGAMAFFRSGLFTVRLGDADVAVGPNLILQIMLQALDRSYDRQRAVPRADHTNRIMAGVSFADTRSALPAICFNLMQNVSEDEQKALDDQIAQLQQRTDITDDTKALVMGLALLNIVGEHTLATAVDALGKTIRTSKPLDKAIVLELAKIPPAAVLTTLPQVCNTVCHESLRQDDPAQLVAEIAAFNLPDENKAILTLYKLTQVYGSSPVALAISTMA